MEFIVCMDVNGFPDANNSSKLEAPNLEDALDVYVYLKMASNEISSTEEKITVWVLDDDFWEQIIMIANAVKDNDKILSIYSYLLKNN